MLVNLVSKFGLVNPKKKVNFGESKFTSFGASGCCLGSDKLYKQSRSATFVLRQLTTRFCLDLDK